MEPPALGLRTPDVFVVPLVSRSLSGAIREVVEGLWLAGRVSSAEAVVRAVLSREARGSTVFARGLAAPHARLAEMAGVAFGIGVSPRGLEDGTRLVLLSASSPEASTEYLRLLAGIGGLALRPEYVERLAAAHTPEEAAACFPGSRGGYRNGFVSLCAPLVPSLVYRMA